MGYPSSATPAPTRSTNRQWSASVHEGVYEMEYLVDAVPYGRAGWRTASITTRMSTLHALYRQSDELICFDVDQAGPVRELDSRVVDSFPEIVACGWPAQPRAA